MRRRPVYEQREKVERSEEVLTLTLHFCVGIISYTCTMEAWVNLHTCKGQ